MITLYFEDGRTLNCNLGTSLLQACREFHCQGADAAAEAVIDGDETDLQKPLQKSGKVIFVPIKSEAGMRVYERTLLFLFLVAAAAACPDLRFETRNSLGSALYVVVRGRKITSQEIKDITEEMRRLIAIKEPIGYAYVTRKEVIEYSKKDGTAQDRSGLLDMMPDRQRFVANVLCGYHGYFFGPVLPSADLVSHFELIPFEDGLVLNKPSVHTFPEVETWSRTQRINSIYDEAEAWSAMIGCNTVAKLNKLIAAGQTEKIIRVTGALQEKKIAAIADQITDNGTGIKLVLIAGPSSSGKTSFAQRLSDQLQVNGIQPLPISMDNYYLNRRNTPKKPDGSYDFESVEAIDLPLFNEHLSRLLQGETIKLPKYNFRSGIREYRGDTIKMSANSVLVVEGIHALNDRLTASIPKSHKVKIFVSALTPLSLDDYNRIHTTDTRLLRRIVRDSQFRSHDAAMTIEMWPSVREGEEKYIFPFQEEADIFFNTSLIYELAVLKKYAEPLLKAISKTESAYVVGKRLLDFLALISPMSDETIPNNSILREFLGGSVFKDAL